MSTAHWLSAAFPSATFNLRSWTVRILGFVTISWKNPTSVSLFYYIYLFTRTRAHTRTHWSCHSLGDKHRKRIFTAVSSTGLLLFQQSLNVFFLFIVMANDDLNLWNQEVNRRWEGGNVWLAVVSRLKKDQVNWAALSLPVVPVLVHVLVLALGLVLVQISTVDVCLTPGRIIGFSPGFSSGSGLCYSAGPFPYCDLVLMSCF